VTIVAPVSVEEETTENEEGQESV
ncbi:50S ribosomal protein L25, partial [Clostridioides difficile]|nr:50S ribosomal protein L25 [Clostridioides difficile]